MSVTGENTRKSSKKPIMRKLIWILLAVSLAILAFWQLNLHKRSNENPLATQHDVAMFLQRKVSELTEQLLTDFPSSTQIIDLAADYNWYCNKVTTAIEILENGLKYDPDNLSFNRMIAHAAYSNGDYPKAIACWKKIISITPQDWRAYDDIAEALMLLGEYEKSAKLLEKKNDIAPPSAQSLFLLGQAYLQLQNYDRAKLCFETCLSMNPAGFTGHYYLAQTYSRLGQRQKAKEAMETHKKIRAAIASPKEEKIEEAGMSIIDSTSAVRAKKFPKLLTQLCVTGNKLYNAQRNTKKTDALIEKTEKTFKKAISKSPGTADLHYQFALMYVQLDRKLIKAKITVEKAIELDPKNDSYKRLLEAIKKKGR